MFCAQSTVGIVSRSPALMLGGLPIACPEKRDASENTGRKNNRNRDHNLRSQFDISSDVRAFAGRRSSRMMRDPSSSQAVAGTLATVRPSGPKIHSRVSSRLPVWASVVERQHARRMRQVNERLVKLWNIHLCGYLATKRHQKHKMISRYHSGPFRCFSARYS